MRRLFFLLMTAGGLALSGPSSAVPVQVTIDNINVTAGSPLSEFSMVSPVAQDFVHGVDFGAPSSAPGPAHVGAVTGFLERVGGLGLGCEGADFDAFGGGTIALIERGACFFSDKVNNAFTAGATGVVIYNNFAGITDFGLNDPTFIPSIFVTRDLGLEFQRLLTVPEPGTFALLGLGLLGLGGAPWRYKARSRPRA